MLQGYTSENIWNLNETACFWRALPDHGFGRKGTQCKGGKKVTQNNSCLNSNATGSKETAAVIWKSAKPRCFKSVDTATLPVQYFSQPKVWMTGKILLSVLRKLNQRLSDKSRKIGLFMDNAGYHPEDIKDSLNNIKSIFLPANTTLMLQPLDLGIIKNFKVHYRTHLLRFVISKIETCTTASEVTKSINILHAIRWVAQAWEAVKPKMCFRKGGVLDESFAVPSCPCEKSDAFKDEDEVDTSEMHNLIGQLGPAEG